MQIGSKSNNNKKCEIQAYKEINVIWEEYVAAYIIIIFFMNSTQR